MITIVDYGMGNLGSIKNMLRKLGADSCISAAPDDVLSAEKLILPGVGHFDRAMRSLNERGLVEPLNQRVLVDRVPFLGICLGMQLLTKGSEEGGEEPGLGWLDASTVQFRFPPGSQNLRVPHMGWNLIQQERESPLLADMYEEPRFYFVHTFHVQCNEPANVLCTTMYGKRFHSAVIKDNIMGTQFHPEKSHKFGLRLLDNFVNRF